MAGDLIKDQWIKIQRIDLPRTSIIIQKHVEKRRNGVLSPPSKSFWVGLKHLWSNEIFSRQVYKSQTQLGYI